MLNPHHRCMYSAAIYWTPGGHLVKHQALVNDKHVQFPFSLAIIEMMRCRHYLAYVKVVVA